MIRLADARVDESAIALVADVLRSGRLISGDRGAAFEEALAAYVGCEDVVLTSSGTAALHLALLAHDVGPGDAVVVPDFTFPATANAVAVTGARPVIVDVDPTAYTMSPESLDAALRSWEGPEQLRGIMPVHEFGLCADMESINRIAQEFGLFVIEDAACALGSTSSSRKAGTLGDSACFSFHPRKSLTTGEGGAVATNDRQTSERLRRLRNHGMERVDGVMKFAEIGLNYRLTDFQAALGLAQLPTLDAAIQRRREVARVYTETLEPRLGPGLMSLPMWDDGHAWQTYMVVLADDIDRSKLVRDLASRDVEVNVGAQSLYVMGLYASPSNVPSVGPVLADRGLALPCHGRMSAKDAAAVVDALVEAVAVSRAH